MIVNRIGIFDSGIGGLTVLREITRLLPHQRIVYLGDTARVPYGSKSPETVTRFTRQGTKFLKSKGVALIVIACNTASALSLNILQKESSLPILGVLKPGAQKAVQLTKKGIIGVVGTEATVRSRAYTRAIKGVNSGVEVVEKSCPLLVPLVEEGWLRGEITHKILGHYLGPLLRRRIDTLILGCTHYPLLEDTIREIVGEEVKLVDSAREVALEVKKITDRISFVPHGNSSLDFFVTDQPGRFARVAKLFLKRRITDRVKKTNLD